MQIDFGDKSERAASDGGGEAAEAKDTQVDFLPYEFQRPKDRRMAEMNKRVTSVSGPEDSMTLKLADKIKSFANMTFSQSDIEMQRRDATLKKKCYGEKVLLPIVRMLSAEDASALAIAFNIERHLLFHSV